MSYPEYQSLDITAPNYQNVCNSICAIDKPNGTADFYGEKVMRRTMFEVFRDAAGIHVAIRKTIGSPDLTEELGELYSTASGCVDRIASGDCSKFLMNTGQIPGSKLGVVPYEVAQEFLNDLDKEE